MPTPRLLRRTLAMVAVVGLLIGSVPVATAADPASRFTAKGGVSQAGRIDGFKAASAGLVKSDPDLVKRGDSARVNVIIKLDYDAVASYSGGVGDLAATSPQVTGKALTGKSAAETKYTAHIKKIESKAVSDIKAKVPTAKIGQTLRTVYGGVAATVPAKSVKDILRIDGVVAVQTDHLNQPLTDASADFIDATPVYPSLGGTADAGEGVIYGNLDSGVWPEHASFADLGNLSAPPAKADGTPRTCDFGDNPLTPAADVFSCQNKLIGGTAFIDTYNALIGGEVYPDTARDSNGHGTHTASTSAGNVVPSAPIFGIERGPIHGIAPGAWVSVYKVCGVEGCFGSDTSAAVGQAILDGVDVINYSISGGTDPFSDATELAFLDAYAAGVFVSTSAGNEGPAASTANHLSPWVMSVAASTQTREFDSTLTVSSSDGTTFTTHGASITTGAGPLPIVLSSAPPYNDNLCASPAPPGIFAGKIVACQRSPGRIQKGFNVKQGGAAGMVLYNPSLADALTDNHFLPTVHLADGTAFKAYVLGHPGLTASFTAGVKQNGQGDVIANFSSRGPAGMFIKPDVTAPGVQILAGTTPTPDEIAGGQPGEYFMAIAGTSMSSPHVAGAGILLKALHPTWTPGQIKSALMTTADTDVVKDDTVTPADPFDFGGGRIDVDDAGAAKLTFDATADDYFARAGDPLQAVHLNLPSIDAPVMPGSLTTTRWVTNVTGSKVDWKLSATAPAGSKIEVKPKDLHLNAGETKSFEVTISSDAPIGAQQFGQVVLTEKAKKGQAAQRLHLQVAFIHAQGDVNLSQSCVPTSIPKNGTTTCEVTASNNGFSTQTVDLASKTTGKVDITSAVGATKQGKDKAHVEGIVLGGNTPGVPSVAPGSLAGYIPLDAFGGTLVAPIGDEQFLKFNVPAFTFNGLTYDQVSVDSNGYLVAGGDATSEDNNCCDLALAPSPSRPNDVLAPFWTDLDGTGAPGILLNVLTDGVNDWLVVEWRVNDFGTTHGRAFQTWIGVDGFQDITFAYDGAQTAPAGQDFQFGAENSIGQGEINAALPDEDQRVTSTDPAPGESYTYTLTLKGKGPGVGTLTSSMSGTGILGTTIVKTEITVTP